MLLGLSLTLRGEAAWYLGPVLVAVAMVGILGRTLTDSPDWLCAAWLRWFGTRSYSLYLWHIAPAWLLRDGANLPWWSLVVVVFPISAVLAELSFRCVEQPLRAPRAGRMRAPRSATPSFEPA